MSDLSSFEIALVPVGKVLLMGSLGLSLFSVIRGRLTYQEAIEGVVIGLVAILFFSEGRAVLQNVSSILTHFVQKVGHGQSLKSILLESFQRAASEPTKDGRTSSFNIPAVLEQAWRTGIWGVMSAVVDWCFLVTSFILESTQQVFWSLLVFLFPLGCGVYPVLPDILKNLTLFAVELSLWTPLLAIVERTTSLVAVTALNRTESLGLYLVAVEIVAIILIFSIPSFTHRFLGGAIHGDLGVQDSVIRITKQGASVVAGIGGGL